MIDCLGVALSILNKSFSILSSQNKSVRTNEKIPSEGIF
jgi:hypothetical protein